MRDISLTERYSFAFEDHQRTTHEQRTKIFGAILNLNSVIDELADEDKVLHIYNVPEILLPTINEYNRTQRGPDSTPINITAVCIKALQDAVNYNKRVWVETADEMLDNPEDVDGRELNEGDRVSFFLSGTEYEGIVFLRIDEYCVKCGEENFIINDNLLELRLLPYTMDNYEMR